MAQSHKSLNKSAKIPNFWSVIQNHTHPHRAITQIPEQICKNPKFLIRHPNSHKLPLSPSSSSIETSFLFPLPLPISICIFICTCSCPCICICMFIYICIIYQWVINHQNQDAYSSIAAIILHSSKKDKITQKGAEVQNVATIYPNIPNCIYILISHPTPLYISICYAPPMIMIPLRWLLS